ncbi:hypothetical protein BD769DRAFT_1669818 [Suillus cothurnatus]|nr:hypothetical protein BD769DRAFT_1669818 [Suillus cothurnatus]
MSTNPLENSQNSQQSRPKQHAAMFRSSKRSILELLNDPATASDIINEHTARIALETRLFITPVAEITIDTLTTALLEFSVQAPSLTPMHIDIICAIAILLFKTDHEQKANIISDAVCTHLEKPLTWLNKMIDNTPTDGVNLESLNEALKKMEASVDKITNAMKEMKESVDKLAPSINSTQGNNTNTVNIESSLEKLQQEMTTLVKEMTQKNRYKAALLSGLDNNAVMNWDRF